VRIGELAEACRIFFSKRLSLDPKGIAIKRIGVQPGEKVHEELMNETEMASAVDSDDFYVINPNQRVGGLIARRGGRNGFSSNDVSPLSTEEMVSELSQLYSSRGV
jgi:FlaA1/EpsC-like NDP-sugar epimerase